MSSPELAPGRDFTRAVMNQLPAADGARRRRRFAAAATRPAVAVLVSLVGVLAGASALPAYGATSTRAAVKAVSWMMVGQSVASNISSQLLGDLNLRWLPLLTALAVLMTIAYGAERRMRRSRHEGGRGLIVLLAVVIVSAALVPALAFGRGTVHLGPLRIAPGETLSHTLLVVAGDVDLEGRSAQPLIVLGGDVRVQARADDDVVALGGNVLLGPGAVAARDVVAIGGRVLRSEDSIVVGNVAGQELRLRGAPIQSEQQLAGAAAIRFRLALLGAAAGMLMAIAAVTLVPWIVVLSAASARGAPLHSALLGLAGLACAPLLIVPLALSLVGAPLAAIVGLALALCWWLGASAAGFLIGRRILRLFGREGSLTRATLVGGALLGSLVGVPMVGGVVLVLIGAAGAGAVLLALIEGEFGSARAPEATVGMMAYE